MFVILDGSARVEWRGGSVELGPGAFFGELTLLAPGGTRIARVRAATEMRCLAIARDDAIALIESEPTVALVDVARDRPPVRVGPPRGLARRRVEERHDAVPPRTQDLDERDRSEHAMRAAESRRLSA